MFFYGKDGKLEKVIEPISPAPDRNAEWTKGMSNAPVQGAVREEDSIITEANGFKNIRYVKSGGTDNFV